MDITAIHQIFLTCTSVTTDSRNCPQGSLFIALKGESFNGNAFAARALESGSAYAIVDEEAYAPEGDTRYIVVENSLKTLQQLANYHRRQMRTPIIGITGTNGKTTTKELMSTVLSQTHNVLYTLGNLNNHIGVPLTLLRLRPEHDLAVVEMGASHPGDIKELVEIAEPDYGIITNVGKAHLEGFGSFEGIIKTKGEMYDYLRALESGSAYAIVDEEAYAPEGDTRYIVVENSLKTLQQLANYHRRQMRTPIIGITGTNGKTTTKELMSTVLSQTHNVLYTLGNLNNHIGVPLTLLRLRPEHDLAVVEMGASHPGDIKELVEIAEPDYGIITNVGKAHLEGFGSFEGIIKTKGEMYDYLRTRKEATIFIHNDNPYLKKIAYGLHQIAYGSEDGLYINGHVTGNSPYLTFEWKTDNESKYHEVQTRLIGEYNFPNALAAVTIGHFFGVEPEKIDKALAGYTPQNNRSQLKKTADNTLIIDAYNANPTSMMASISNFRNMQAENKMLILGDMRELGKDSADEHQKIADYLEECGFKDVVLVGELFAATRHSYQSYPDVTALIAELQREKPCGKTILIKGSNGIKLSSVVEYL